MILASASPARRSVLRAAGVEPIVRVSGVDEDAIAAALPADALDTTVVEELARAKARSVAASIGADAELPATALVIGCDSMLAVGGALVGKPADARAAHDLWTSMAGGSGRLLTGHAVVVVTDGTVTAEAVDHTSTVVHFGVPTERELAAYIADGEPLTVAGSFTLDGLGGWFIDAIEGDPSSVIGIGLPLVRRLLATVGVDIAQLWADNPVG